MKIPHQEISKHCIHNAGDSQPAMPEHVA